MFVVKGKDISGWVWLVSRGRPVGFRPVLANIEGGCLYPSLLKGSQKNTEPMKFLEFPFSGFFHIFVLIDPARKHGSDDAFKRQGF
jgi:hypothetical protein